MNTRLTILAVLCFACCAKAELQLPSILSDHAVLQRDSEVVLWGWDKPGQRVSLQCAWLKEPITATCAANARFEMRMRTPAHGKPVELTFSGSSTVTVKDVVVGEVWLCGGQSNMEWSIGPVVGPGVENYEQVLENPDPRIRVINIPHNVGRQPSYAGPATAWQPASAASIRGFSAVGYFFGRELARELDVPIGLIGCNWGGTPAESWTSAEGLRPLPAFAGALRAMAEDRKPTRTPAVTAWWQRVASLNANRMQPEYDDATWASHQIPGHWSGDGLETFDGVFWYRRTVDLPNEMRGKDLTLTLGPIDDMDTVWANGARIGGTERAGAWNTPRRYVIPGKHLTGPKLVLAIRIIDTGQGGGMHGDADAYALSGGSQRVSLAGPWRWQRGAPLSDLGPMPRTPQFNQYSPSGLYNGMLHRVVPYTLRGATFYQGESNRRRAAQYERLFPALIKDWRRAFANPDLPFYFVQIAPFLYGNDRGEAAELRDAQRLALSIPNTGMAVTLDIGDPRDIHPGNKDEVGRRLSLWALRDTYGHDIAVVSGPLYRSHRVEGNTIRLQFDSVGNGLIGRDDLTGFIIAGEDQRFVPATARIVGNEVLVSSPQVPEPRAVRYGWDAACNATLFNQAGLPASSFRTDRWAHVSK